MRFQLTSLFDLTGKTALVTGGNSGIGRAMARALGKAGATVVLAARRQAEMTEAVGGLLRDGIEAKSLIVDLAAKDCEKMVIAELYKLSASPDILVNAAGVNLRQPFGDVTSDAFDLHMALHLRTPFLLTQALAPAMAERRFGRIINIASLQSYRAFPNSAPYGAAKGGVVQLTRAIAEAWSNKGITCNAIAPGFFPTPLTATVFSDPERSAKNAAQTAIGRNGELDDLTGVTVFLASAASAYITGQTLGVDGGFTAK
jgi:NAD(P)-dependent dehydrogenase (short-subunit alcohol dehydrogenase family)